MIIKPKLLKKVSFPIQRDWKWFWALLLLLNTTIGVAQTPYTGGNSGTQSLAIGDFTTCTIPLANIGKGGSDDGYFLSSLINVVCDSNDIYRGGNAGAQALAIGDFTTCTIPIANVDIGGSDDGHSWDSTGCVVVVNPCTMVPSADSTTTICYGDSTQLQVSATDTQGLDPLTYLWTPELWLSDTSIANPVATPLATTVYTVYITDSICTKTSFVTVVVNPKPIANAGNDTAICLNQNTTIGIAPVAGKAYDWISVPVGFTSTTANPSVNPIVSTIYVLTATDTLTGCTNSDSVTVTVNPLPLATGGPDAYVCPGESALIGAVGVAGNTYLWTPSAELSSATDPNPTVTPTFDTTYILMETVTATGCQKSDTVFVSVIPTTSISGIDSICLGQSTTLTASGGGSSPVYAWTSVPAGAYPATSAITVNPSVSTKYIVTITDGPCSSSDSITVIVNPLPVANTGGNQSICYGNSVAIGAAAVAGNTYLWSPATGLSSTTIANPIANPIATTTYTLTETTTATNCQKSNTVDITVYPEIKITGGGITICSGGSATLVASGGSGVTPAYSWTSVPAGAYPATQSIIVSPTTTTTYTLELTDANCGPTTATATINYVAVCVQENVFTGGSDDGFSSASLVNVSCNSNMYLGGNSGANTSSIGDFSTCTLPTANVGKGGDDDGYSFSTLTNVFCNPNILYLGGNSGANALSLGNFSTCTSPLANIGKGGNDDGYSFSALTNVFCNPNILYLGGNSGANALSLGDFSTCTLPIANIAIGGTEDGFSVFTTGFPIGGCPTAIPVPIELLNFTAILLSDKLVQCKWKTATEINNDYFTIEKSKDGIDFSVVDEIKGAGNSTNILNYSIMDDDPYKGTSYYRLKQTDFDGTQTYSHLETITILSDGIAINIYPNPVMGQLTVHTFTKEGFTAVVEINDMLGEKVFYKKQHITDGNKLLINTSSFGQGVYLLRIKDLSTNKLLHIERVVKLN